MYSLPASLKPHEAVLRAAGRRAARERIAMVAALHAVRREGNPTPSDPRGSPAAAEERSAPLSEKEMVNRILSNVLRDGDVDLASAESAANKIDAGVARAARAWSQQLRRDDDGAAPLGRLGVPVGQAAYLETLSTLHALYPEREQSRDPISAALSAFEREAMEEFLRPWMTATVGGLEIQSDETATAPAPSAPPAAPPRPVALSDDDDSADEGASAELARLAVAAKHDSSDDDSPARGAAVRAAGPPAAPKWEESRPAHRGVSLDMD